MAHSISLRSVVAALQGQVSRVVGDEVVILDSERGLYFGLNSVGARIWTLLDKPTEVTEIRKVILQEFEVDDATCERDLLALLDELLSRNMIELRPPTPPSPKLPTSDL